MVTSASGWRSAASLRTSTLIQPAAQPGRGRTAATASTSSWRSTRPRATTAAPTHCRGRQPRQRRPRPSRRSGWKNAPASSRSCAARAGGRSDRAYPRLRRPRPSSVPGPCTRRAPPPATSPCCARVRWPKFSRVNSNEPSRAPMPRGRRRRWCDTFRWETSWAARGSTTRRLPRRHFPRCRQLSRCRAADRHLLRERRRSRRARSPPPQDRWARAGARGPRSSVAAFCSRVRRCPTADGRPLARGA